LELKPTRAVSSALSGTDEKKTLGAGDEIRPLTSDCPLVAAYERLREQGLVLGVGTSGLCGLGVLLQQGMVGWMRAASCWTADRATPVDDPTRPTLPAGLAVPIVTLLSGMVIAHVSIERGEPKWN
jgi:hypothetical protein